MKDEDYTTDHELSGIDIAAILGCLILAVATLFGAIGAFPL